ncbi:hypothetical protein FisN_18Hh276 [Fistulifera solaris]|uniref:Uncharacterized protein n=1 Tax=Fistulifera solaris TaxID=1519565 RepID=A0A1Z5KIM2_FISSO|nr:hypothetical protein FisN_18Hh276 [Fistulifera solaris]|eukprot:GAX26160.1 hypothetical protein FisN_18Hh276 [Fistulifera solaris]
MLNTASSSRASAMQLQHLLQKVSQTSRESWQLTRACWKSSPALSSDRLKAILLEQAQSNNRVAVRLLLLEKEWVLLKYHGASKYLQQKWSSRRALPNATDSNQQLNVEQRSDNNNKEVVTETAQIAFMITSRMKQQLREELGYNETLLKAMTPLQASLVLQNQIIADDYNDKLPQLEDYHKQQELKRKEEEELRARIEQHKAEENELARVNESSRSSSTESFPSKQVSSQTPFLQNASLSSVSQSTGGNKITWYEVIQIRPDGEEQNMGLYKSSEEAQEGIDALQYIAQRRKEKKDVTFSIRPSLR